MHHVPAIHPIVSWVAWPMQQFLDSPSSTCGPLNKSSKVSQFKIVIHFPDYPFGNSALNPQVDPGKNKSPAPAQECCKGASPHCFCSNADYYRLAYGGQCVCGGGGVGKVQRWSHKLTRAGGQWGTADQTPLGGDWPSWHRPHFCSQPGWPFLDPLDFAGEDLRSPIGVTATWHRVKRINFPYLGLHCRQPQPCPGYGIGQMACLSQHGSGSGSQGAIPNGVRLA